MSIIFGIPSKGSLYDGTVSLLNNASLGLKPRRKGQSYWGKLSNVPDVAVQYMRAEELPVQVASGEIHLAITGLDLFREFNTNPSDSFVLLDDLNFGHARLVVAVPNFWLDVGSIEDLTEVAFDIKKNKGRNLRVGTKFTKLTREYFEKQGLLNFSIVKSAGATEAMPQAGAADIIVDLTSSGSTLVTNNLKEIKGGTIIDSQACLIGSQSLGSVNAQEIGYVQQILEMVEASLLSKDHCLIHFSIEEKKLWDLRLLLSRENGCMFDYEASVFRRTEAGEAPVFAGIICPIKETYNVVCRLRSEDAFGISVGDSSLMFSNNPSSTARLTSLLNRQSK